jgi:hypothetical protein
MAKRRLVFSASLQQTALRIGSDDLIPYDAIDIIKVSPEQPVQGTDAHWIEIQTMDRTRKVFLGGAEEECAQRVFERSREAVLIDKRGEEHVHEDTQNPMRGIRSIVRERSRAARISCIIALVMCLWATLPIISIFSRGKPTFDNIDGAILISLAACGAVIVAVINIRKAIEARRELRRAQERTG